jgi:ubiquinone/menaquinone biosynthesis C-methylase UbiE
MTRKLCGREIDRMQDFAFKIMGWMFVIRDWISSPGSLLDEFEISGGQTVVDYGCGTGSYLKKASELVGKEGKVYAVDIHELAIEAVERRIRKENLTNVKGIIVRDQECLLEIDTADVIYALDMFHMVRDTDTFLLELNRISRHNGLLYIDNGHQSRQDARSKIITSGAWEIIRENDRYMTCRPVGQ